MSVKKMPSGRYRAKLKSGRVDVASKVFDTQREANAWLARERAALAGGVDPRAGKQRVSDVLDQWLPIRENTVAQKTYKRDADLRRLLPTSIQALHLSSVSGREVGRWYELLLREGMAESSVVRARASLSAFFEWCVREKLVLANPVKPVKVPKQSDEPVEMLPYTEDELEERYKVWSAHNERLANLMLILGWTGLRWSEARSIRVGDVMEVPTPALVVRRGQPEGVELKSTKGRRSRRVPLADRVLPLVLGFAEGKARDDLLFTTARGSQLHRAPVTRSIRWEQTSEGRRIHDLRHTAACLWLTLGVDVTTVQAWMGHESIATTNLYLHYLGTGADEAGLSRLNKRSGGTRGARRQEEAE